MNENDLRNFEELDKCVKSYPSSKQDWELCSGQKLFLKYVSYQKIPCGHCMSCRLNHSKQWATRCMLEAESWDENWFITLTYDDEHHEIPDEFTDKNGITWTNDGSWNGCLKPKDLTNFNKSLREYYRTTYNHIGIRFFACGEYGTESGRNHFHEILFNLPISPFDLKYYKTTSDGNILYTCDKIAKIWGKGYVVIGHFNWSTAAYVARYVTKKFTGETSDLHYGVLGQIPEFSRSSNRPGIARWYYEKYRDKLYENDELIVKTCKDTTIITKPPKYFDKLYDIDYPDDMEKIKLRRQFEAEQAQRVKDYTTTLSREKQLLVEERELELKTKILKRGL